MEWEQNSRRKLKEKQIEEVILLEKDLDYQHLLPDTTLIFWCNDRLRKQHHC